MTIRRPAAPVIPSAGKRFDPAGEAAFRREMERSLQDLGAVMAAGIDDSQLSANVALRDAANNFTNTGGQTFRGEVKIILAGASDHIRLERTGSAVDDMDIQFASSGLFLTWSGVSSTARFNFNGAANRLDMPSPMKLQWGNTDAVQGTTFDVNLYRFGANELGTDDSFRIGLNLNHDGSNIGFFGTTPTSKKTVTGSRGGNAALASLLTQLAAYGLITDSTT